MRVPFVTILSMAISSLLFATPTSAQTICLNEEETTAFARLALDKSSETLTRVCSSSYTKSAPFLTDKRSEIDARFEDRKGEAYATLAAKLIPFLPSASVAKSIVDPLVEVLVNSVIEKEITEQTCRDADPLFEAFAILDDEDLVQVMSVLVRKNLNASSNELLRYCPTAPQSEAGQ